MKKYVIQGSFGLDNLKLVDAPKPEPGRGQVLVRIKAVSLNFRDLMTVQGLYNPTQPLPLVPLSDGAGEVVATGDGVTRVKVGDRVCTTFFQKWIKGEPTADELRSTLGGPQDGTLTEYMALDENGVVHSPGHLSDEEAATLPCAALTAWTALVTLGKVKPGDTVLTLGTGGVSIFALQFAKMAGAKVISTSSDENKMSKLKELGADYVINYAKDPGWGKTIREITGGGVEHVIEVGGAGTLGQSLQAVRIRGRVSVIGVLTGPASNINIRPIIMKSPTIQGIFVGNRDSFDDMNRAIALNRMKPVVDRVFAFDEARKALEHMAGRKHFGKVVIKIG